MVDSSQVDPRPSSNHYTLGRQRRLEAGGAERRPLRRAQRPAWLQLRVLRLTSQLPLRELLLGVPRHRRAVRLDGLVFRPRRRGGLVRGQPALRRQHRRNAKR